MPSFRQVLAHAERLYREHRGEVERVGRELLDHLAAATRLPKAADSLTPGWLEAVVAAATDEFDERNLIAPFPEPPEGPG